MDLWTDLSNIEDPSYLPGILLGVAIAVMIAGWLTDGLTVNRAGTVIGVTISVIGALIGVYGGYLAATEPAPYSDQVVERVTQYLQDDEGLVVLEPPTYDHPERTLTASAVEADGTTVDVTVTWVPLENVDKDLPKGFNPIKITRTTVNAPAPS